MSRITPEPPVICDDRRAAARRLQSGAGLFGGLRSIESLVRLARTNMAKMTLAEKLAAARGTADPWVLEALAKLCERLARGDPAMLDRALRYWDRLEAATGVSYARERAAAMAAKTLREGGFPGSAGDGD